MKLLAILLCCGLLLAPISQVNAAGEGAPGRVVLTAGMVHSAIDIEAAIVKATQDGARPGVVILDGRDGPFAYAPDALDVDVNIWVSDLILRGVHRAVLQGGAINLDGMPLNNISIQGLKMECPQDCITSPDGLHQNVVVRDNRLQAGNNGIDVGWTDGWQIKNNRITAAQVAIHLVSADGIRVDNNHLQGYIPVMLEAANHSKIINNILAAEWQGVLLASDSQANRVIANSIFGVQAAGIALGPDTLENRVHANWVQCAAEAPGCLIVEDLGTDNHTEGNRP